MDTYDLLMVFVLLATTLFGFWKGMAWQIASLASIVVSYIAALRFSEQLAPVFGEHAPWNRFVAMLAIYIVTSFIIWTMFRLVSGAIDKVKLEAFDRQLGAMFGLAKGVLLCVVITFFAVTLLPPVQGEAIVASRSGRYIVLLLDKSHSVLPPEVHEVVDPYLNKIEERLNQDFEPHGQDFQAAWPQTQPQTSANSVEPQSAPWPQQNQSQQPQGWPQPTSEQQPTQSWPTQPPPLGEQTPISSPWGAQQQGGQSRAQSPFDTTHKAQATNPYAVPRQAQLPDPYAVPREPNPFPGPFSDE